MIQEDWNQNMVSRMNNEKHEIWKDIPGYVGIYQVSNLGEVRSIDRYIYFTDNGTPTRKFHKGRILKQDIDEDGYCRINLRYNNKDKSFGVHRLVAAAFISNIDNLPTVNHIDGNKQNNCIENLEWASVEYQNLHAIKTGLREGTMSAARKASMKKISKPVRCIQTGEIFPSCNAADKALHLGSTAVFHSLKYNRPTVQGYTFELI